MKIKGNAVKRTYAFMLTCMLLLSIPSVSLYASSLDDVISGSSQQVEQSVTTPTPSTEQNVTSSNSGGSTQVNNEDYISAIHNATNLGEPSPEANAINQYIKKGASFFIQVVSYFITAFLAVTIMIDMMYITLPFTRVFLANGYTGSVQAGVGMADGGTGFGAGQPGMNGGMMGGNMMGGMNSGMNGGMMGGGYGRYGGGYGRYGGGMNGGMMGGNQMNQMNQMQQMHGKNPILGRVQLVSSAALDAVAAESTPGMDNKPDSALKVYAKKKVVELVLTPILLVLAISGALVDLGFLLGDLLVDGIAQIGNMI